MQNEEKDLGLPGSPVPPDGEQHPPSTPTSGESFEEQLERVRMMAEGGETWDLSDNDRAALSAVLAAYDDLADRAAW